MQLNRLDGRKSHPLILSALIGVLLAPLLVWGFFTSPLAPEPPSGGDVLSAQGGLLLIAALGAFVGVTAVMFAVLSSQRGRRILGLVLAALLTPLFGLLAFLGFASGSLEGLAVGSGSIVLGLLCLGFLIRSFGGREADPRDDLDKIYERA